MTKPFSKVAKLTLVAASVALLSYPATAAWNPAAPGSAPAAAAQGRAPLNVEVEALTAESNPDAAGYDKKFKQGPWPGVDSSGSKPVYNAGSGGAPSYQYECIMVKGYAYSTGCIMGANSGQSLYNYVNYQFTQVMQWLEKIYNYLAHGQGGDDKGLIGSIHEEHKLDRIYLEEQLALHSKRMQELMMKSAYANDVASKVQDYRACDDLPRTMGAISSTGGGGYGAGGGGSINKGKTEDKAASYQAGSTPNEAVQAAKVYSTHQNYCSKWDVSFFNSDGSVKGPRNAFNCTASDPMPDADARAQSVFTPAHDYTDPVAVKKATLTYDISEPNNPKTNHKLAADAAIANIVAAFSPPALPKGVEETEAGKLYLSKTKVFNARVSAAIHTLSAMADRRTPRSNGLQEQTQTTWFGDDWDDVYERIFGTTAPKAMSEADSLRFEVYRRYWDMDTKNNWMAKNVLRGYGDGLMREMLKAQSVQMLLLYNMHQRLEENNMIQAAILANQINPVTKAEMLRDAANTFRSQKSSQ